MYFSSIILAEHGSISISSSHHSGSIYLKNYQIQVFSYIYVFTSAKLQHFPHNSSFFPKKIAPKFHDFTIFTISAYTSCRSPPLFLILLPHFLSVFARFMQNYAKINLHTDFW